MNILTVKPLILAHRGASSRAPENTLAAFELAVRQQADGIELDVHLSSDGIVVVTHDEDCRRVTGEPGLVGEMTLAELKARNFAWSHPEAGFNAIPTLEEVFDLLRPTSLMINIELKNNEADYIGLEGKVLDLTVSYGMEERILLSSFYHRSIADACRIIRDRRLPVRCGLLYSHHLARPWDLALQIGAAAIHPRHVLAKKPEYIKKAHHAGIAVHPWTIDSEGDLEKFMRLGVDAIITNVPDLALEVRERFLQPSQP